jgi:hypothetical protein
MHPGPCHPSHLPVARSGTGKRLPARPAADARPDGMSLSPACGTVAGVTSSFMPGQSVRPVRHRTTALHLLLAAIEPTTKSGFTPRPKRAVPRWTWTKTKGSGKFRLGHSPGGPGRNREEVPHLGRLSAPQPAPRDHPAKPGLTTGFSSWRKYPTGRAGGVKPSSATARPGRTPWGAGG